MTTFKFSENYKFSKERGVYIKRTGLLSIIIAGAFVSFAAILRGTVSAPNPPPWPIFIMILSSIFIVIGFIVPYIVDVLPTEIIFHPDKIEFKRISLPFYLLGIMLYGFTLSKNEILNISTDQANATIKIKTKDKGEIVVGMQNRENIDLIRKHIKNYNWECKIS